MYCSVRETWSRWGNKALFPRDPSAILVLLRLVPEKKNRLCLPKKETSLLILPDGGMFPFLEDKDREDVNQHPRVSFSFYNLFPVLRKHLEKRNTFNLSSQSKQDRMKLDLLLNLYLFLISTNSHLGSKSRPLLSKRAIHPKATAALLGKKQGLPYINPLETLKGLVHSLRVIRFVVENGGSVLVVNTNPALSPVINKLVLINSLEGIKREREGKIFFCNERWIGGLLSNWSQLSKSVLVFKRFFQQFDPFLFENNINLSVYTEMKKKFSGLIPLEPEQLINNFFFLKRKQRSIKRNISNQSSVGEREPLSGVSLGLPRDEDESNHSVYTKTREGLKRKRDLNSSSLFLSLERAKKHKLVQKLRASEEKRRKLSLLRTNSSAKQTPFGKGERSTPTILFLIDPNQNQHVLQETNQLKIPTIAITNSNTDQSGVQYSIPGNTNSIHFVYYCLKCVVSVVNQRECDLTGEM